MTQLTNNNYGSSRRQEYDLRVRVLQLYMLLAGFVLVSLLVFDAVLQRELESDIQAADLALTQAITLQLDTAETVEDVSAWLTMIDIEQPMVIWVVDSSGGLVATHKNGLVIEENNRSAAWQRSVIREAIRGTTGHYMSVDEQGAEWLHTYDRTADGRWVAILQRPTATALTTSQFVHQGLFLAGLLFVGVGFLFWRYLSHSFIAPLQQLETFSDVIRWRGDLRTDEQAQLDILAQRADQLGGLARSLIAMEQDIETRFHQLSTLLETSRVVASSLEAQQVVDNILGQVQALFGVVPCAVVLLDERAGVFRIQASRGMSERYVNEIRIAPSEPNSPAMRAIRNQEPIQVSDTEADLAFEYFETRSYKEGLRSILAIPLATRHAPPAVLILYKNEPYRYSYSELELAASFGNHASIALENAALYAQTDERLQEQTRRLEAIVESLDDGLILASLSGEVLYCNQKALELIRLSRTEGKDLSPTELRARLLATADGSPTTYAESIEISRIHSGRQQDLRLTTFDVNDSRGQLIGRGQLWQDITHDKELDRMKSALLSTVSHELRTPLATIKGYASTLLARDVQWDAAAQEEFLQTISLEADRLTELIKNLLDMSRIEANTLEVNCELYSVNDLLSQVIQGLQTDLRNRLQLDLTPDLPLAQLDLSRIGTVMRNFIDNAAKYSPPDTPIELKTSCQNGHVLFAVRDYGHGIPADYEDKIFDRFVRVDNRLTREVGGVGLGLAICKGFVEAHRGRVWLETADKGVTFGFSLPIVELTEAQ